MALTFDDGYRGVLTHAVPVLERYGWPAMVFVVSGRLGVNNDWDHPGHRRTPPLPRGDLTTRVGIAVPVT